MNVLPPIFSIYCCYYFIIFFNYFR